MAVVPTGFGEKYVKDESTGFGEKYVKVVPTGIKRKRVKEFADLRVVVGLSGGVDSAVAAYLLKEQGYQVIGVTLRTWEAEGGKESRCCEISDARRVAAQLEIPFYNINSLREFDEHVTRPFVESYVNGLTPNPCVGCNRHIKWERLLAFADEINAEYVATGHYAHVVKTESGRYTVKQAASAAKDQTYMLYQLTQEQLARTLMPLADLTKDEVRKIAVEAGIPVADKKDSQEICFVPDGKYSDYICEYIESGKGEAPNLPEPITQNSEKISATNTSLNTNRGVRASNSADEVSQAKPLEIPEPGYFVDLSGKILGPNKGIIHYTVGQRKGLGLALGYPAYVKRIEADTGNVVIGDLQSVYESKILCRDVNFMSVENIKPGEKLRAFVKIRYHHAAAPAILERVDDNTVSAVFDEPVKAPAPGQSAVFYDSENRVIGGGIIFIN